MSQHDQAALPGIFHNSPCRYFFPPDRLRASEVHLQIKFQLLAAFLLIKFICDIRLHQPRLTMMALMKIVPVLLCTIARCFPQSTRRILRARLGQRCSSAKCSAQLVSATPPHQELGSTSGLFWCMAPDLHHAPTVLAERADGRRGTRYVQGVHWTGLKLLSSACVALACNTSVTVFAALYA